MTQNEGKRLLILTARAEYLGELRDRKRISEQEYFAQLNGLRQQAGLEPLQMKTSAPRLAASAAWGI